MIQQDALRRLELLEAQARHVDIRPMAEAAAERLGVDVDELIAEAQRLARRVEEIGFPALEAELAEQAERSGITVEQLYGDVNELFAERGWSPFGAA